MLFSPRHNQQLKTTAHSKMTTIQKMMKQVEQQEKKQQEKLRQEEQQRGMIDNLNLYIPHARDDVSKEQMRENLSRFGKIKVIDFVAKLDKNNRNYNSAYVYFDSWYPTTENKQIQAQIKPYTKTQNKMQSFKLNYDGNLHWIILENTSPAPKAKQERKVVIDLKTPGTEPAVTVTAPVKRTTMTIDDYNVSMTEKEVSEWHKFGDELRAKKRLQEEAAEKRFIEQEKKFSDEADQLLTRVTPELQQELHEDQQEDQQEDQELHEEQEQQEEQDQQEEEQQEDQQEYQEEEYQEEEYQEQYYQSQMTQAFYQYYYWMTMEQRDMDEITTAMDEDDAWDAYLEQIHEECDFCENTLGRDEYEEQDGITTSVDYGYVERLEHELTKVRFQLRRSYS